MEFIDDYIVIKEALGNLDVAEMDTLKKGMQCVRLSLVSIFFILEQITIIFHSQPKLKILFTVQFHYTYSGTERSALVCVLPCLKGKTTIII